MSSPTAIFNALRNRGYRVMDWSGRSRVPKRGFKSVPQKPGVYALYYGETLQHIGSTLRKLGGRLANQRNAQVNYKPHGSFSWFVLPKCEARRAEAYLIDRYRPRYSERRPHAAPRKEYLRRR